MEKLDNLIKSSVLFMDGMWACDVTFHQDSIQALYSQLESQPTSLPIKINVHVYNKKRQLNSTQVDFLPGFYIKTKRLTLSTSPKSICSNLVVHAAQSNLDISTNFGSLINFKAVRCDELKVVYEVKLNYATFDILHSAKAIKDNKGEVFVQLSDGLSGQVNGCLSILC